LTGIKSKKEPQAAKNITEPVKEFNATPPPSIPSQLTGQKTRGERPKSKPVSDVTKITNLDQQALKAFLDGAGLTQTAVKPEEMIKFMNTAGQVMREITLGFRQVLDARADLKGEFRLGMTTLRPAKNNPLKFSIDVEDALTKLLLPPTKGYLPPIEAIHEATDDLQAHQMALLAGLRAALSSLVALFDPEELEKNFQKASAVDNLLPALRKAKYWDMFKAQYKQAAADAENDFLHFLGDEFTAAYEQQVQRLKSVRHKQ
jgi:type VI secretion system FHA domain protein